MFNREKQVEWLSGAMDGADKGAVPAADHS